MIDLISPLNWPRKTRIASFTSVMLSWTSISVNCSRKPWTVRVVKSTTRPIETGPVSPLSPVLVFMLAVPLHASVSVVPAACAVDRPTSVMARAMHEQRRSIPKETPAGPTLAAYHGFQEAVRALFPAGATPTILGRSPWLYRSRCRRRRTHERRHLDKEPHVLGAPERAAQLPARLRTKSGVLLPVRELIPRHVVNAWGQNPLPREKALIARKEPHCSGCIRFLWVGKRIEGLPSLVRTGWLSHVRCPDLARCTPRSCCRKVCHCGKYPLRAKLDAGGGLQSKPLRLQKISRPHRSTDY